MSEAKSAVRMNRLFPCAAGPGVPQDARFSRIGVENRAQRSGARLKNKKRFSAVPNGTFAYRFPDCTGSTSPPAAQNTAHIRCYPMTSMALSQHREANKTAIPALRLTLLPQATGQTACGIHQNTHAYEHQTHEQQDQYCPARHPVPFYESIGEIIGIEPYRYVRTNRVSAQGVGRFLPTVITPSRHAHF